MKKATIKYHTPERRLAGLVKDHQRKAQELAAEARSVIKRSRRAEAAMQAAGPGDIVKEQELYIAELNRYLELKGRIIEWYEEKLELLQLAGGATIEDTVEAFREKFRNP